MKKIEAIVAHETEASLIDWAHSMQPGLPRPSIGEAASLALEHFGRERREMRSKFAHAARKVEAKLGHD